MIGFLLAIVLAQSTPTPAAPSNVRTMTFGTLSWQSGREDSAPTFVLVDASPMAQRIAQGLNDAGLATLQLDGSTDVASAIDALVKDPHVDPDAIYLLGYGEAAARTVELSRGDQRIRGVVLLAPEVRNATGTAIGAATTPLLLLRGSADAVVSAGAIEDLVAAARAAHRNVQYGELTGDDHRFATASSSFDASVGAAIIAWLAETRPAAAPQD